MGRSLERPLHLRLISPRHDGVDLMPPDLSEAAVERVEVEIRHWMARSDVRVGRRASLIAVRDVASLTCSRLILAGEPVIALEYAERYWTAAAMFADEHGKERPPAMTPATAQDLAGAFMRVSD